MLLFYFLGCVFSFSIVACEQGNSLPLQKEFSVSAVVSHFEYTQSLAESLQHYREAHHQALTEVDKNHIRGKICDLVGSQNAENLAFPYYFDCLIIAEQCAHLMQDEERSNAIDEKLCVLYQQFLDGLFPKVTTMQAANIHFSVVRYSKLPCQIKEKAKEKVESAMDELTQLTRPQS